LARARANLDDRVKRLYLTPGHSTAFSAPENVAKFHGITRERARRLLQEVDAYVTHREYKRPAVFNPYFVYRRRALAQADLVDIRQLAADNDGVNYLLVIIDVFSRKIWVYPLRRKNGPAVALALTQWLDAIRAPPPRVFATDHGREFLNPPVRQLLARRGVRQETADGTCKAAVAERVNKSLQILLYKYMSARQTRRYVDQLDRLVRTYNGRPHRTLGGMTPASADLPRNEENVRAVHTARYASVPRRAVKFRVGQVVRVKYESKALTSSSRAYQPQFSPEFFVVREVRDNLPVPLYYLEAMNDGEPIEGGFYSNELTAVGADVFKIDRILEERGEGPRREILVRWMHFGPAWDSWIPAAQVVRYNQGRGRPRALSPVRGPAAPPAPRGRPGRRAAAAAAADAAAPPGAAPGPPPPPARAPAAAEVVRRGRPPGRGRRPAARRAANEAAERVDAPVVVDAVGSRRREGDLAPPGRPPTPPRR
jgi:transposase InsO family protein